MDAAEIYRGLSPRGDKAQVVLPVTEKQLRPLKKLPPNLRLKAWKNAISTASPAPVGARHVEKEVQHLMKKEGITPPTVPKKTGQRFHRLGEEDVSMMRRFGSRLWNSGCRSTTRRSTNGGDAAPSSR